MDSLLWVRPNRVLQHVHAPYNSFFSDVLRSSKLYVIFVTNQQSEHWTDAYEFSKGVANFLHSTRLVRLEIDCITERVNVCLFCKKKKKIDDIHIRGLYGCVTVPQLYQPIQPYVVFMCGLCSSWRCQSGLYSLSFRHIWCIVAGIIIIEIALLVHSVN